MDLRKTPGDGRWFGLLALLLMAAGCGSTPPSTAAERTEEEVASSGEEADTTTQSVRLPSDVRPRRYDLSLALDPSSDTFSGIVEIDVRLDRARRTIPIHGQNLEVTDITVSEAGRDPRPAQWEVVDEARGVAQLTAHRPLGPGMVRIHIEYRAPYDTALEGLYRVSQGSESYVFTQFEPLAARKAFPCFDEPGFKTPFEVTLIVPEAHRALANTSETENVEVEGGFRRVRFRTTEPLPTYLVAFAVGPFSVVEADPIPPNDVRSSPLPFRAFAPAGQSERLAHAVEQTPRLLNQLETYFGSAYPFDKLDIIAVPDFAFGAMENAGLITFRDRFLLLGERPSQEQRRRFAYITAHELAHQWFGNLVTMEWWDDIWLNEAFASWMEHSTIAAVFPEFEPDVLRVEEAVDAMEADSLASARQIRQPIETEHDIHNAFDPITYSKGSAVLGMFERYLTPEVFRQGVRRYLRANANGNATAEDLMSALGEAAGQDVASSFNTFLTQPGVPLLSMEPQCDEEGAVVRISQSRYTPLGSRADAENAWSLPVCVRYRAGGEVRRTCSLVTETTAEIELEGGCPDWIHGNADAAGYYRWTLRDEAMQSLRSRGLRHLTVPEMISYADSIESAFEAGRLGFAPAMEALAPLARRTERPLATAPMEFLRFGIERGAEADQRAAARDYASNLYRPARRRLGWDRARGETTSTTLLRAEVLRFLATVVQDPIVLREGANRGREFIGPADGELRPRALSPDLVETAVGAALAAGDEAFFDLVVSRLATAEPSVRSPLVHALASVRSEGLRSRVLDLSLSADLRTNERIYPLRHQMRIPEAQEVTWRWLTAHYDQLTEMIGPAISAYVPLLGVMAFCEEAQLQASREFFSDRVSELAGGPRNLELGLESAQLCAARQAHARPEAGRFFASH